MTKNYNTKLVMEIYCEESGEAFTMFRDLRNGSPWDYSDCGAREYEAFFDKHIDKANRLFNDMTMRQMNKLLDDAFRNGTGWETSHELYSSELDADGDAVNGLIASPFELTIKVVATLK